MKNNSYFFYKENDLLVESFSPPLSIYTRARTARTHTHTHTLLMKIPLWWLWEIHVVWISHLKLPYCAYWASTLPPSCILTYKPFFFSILWWKQPCVRKCFEFGSFPSLVIHSLVLSCDAGEWGWAPALCHTSRRANTQERADECCVSCPGGISQARFPHTSSAYWHPGLATGVGRCNPTWKFIYAA